MKAFELRTKSKAELEELLASTRQELSSLRVQKAANPQSNKVMKIGETRKNVARILTVISQIRKEQLRLFYKKAKFLPLDLRPKKTRAIRRRLTAYEANKKTQKQLKKERHFPIRKYFF